MRRPSFQGSAFWVPFIICRQSPVSCICNHIPPSPRLASPPHPPSTTRDPPPPPTPPSLPFELTLPPLSTSSIFPSDPLLRLWTRSRGLPQGPRVRLDHLFRTTRISALLSKRSLSLDLQRLCLTTRCSRGPWKAGFRVSPVQTENSSRSACPRRAVDLPFATVSLSVVSIP